MDVQFTPKRYEAALLERLTQQFPPPLCKVCGTREGKWHRVQGEYSGARRQLDAAVYRAGAKSPFLVADAKCHRTRKIGLPQVECFLGLLDDIRCGLGLMASPLGFTKPAIRRVGSAVVTLMVMSYAEALEAEWLPIARRVYPLDWAFHPQLASALLAIDEGGPAEEVVDALHEVPFEEWQGFVRYALSHHPAEAAQFLKEVAKHHWDDGWRFNAVQFLLDEGLLDPETRDQLRKAERDPEVLELLADY